MRVWNTVVKEKDAPIVLFYYSAWNSEWILNIKNNNKITFSKQSKKRGDGSVLNNKTQETAFHYSQVVCMGEMFRNVSTEVVQTVLLLLSRQSVQSCITCRL